MRENCNMTLQVGGGVKDFETIEKAFRDWC
ncbi:hypothetical protein ACP8HZ_03715 [Francisella noatunensis]